MASLYYIMTPLHGVASVLLHILHEQYSVLQLYYLHIKGDHAGQYV